MIFRIRKKQRLEKVSCHNRLHVIMAIIFLLAGAIFVKLYSLQILKYDLYAATAESQHLIYNKLEPNRGRIFIRDGKSEENNKLYPLADNKDFALVYAIPKIISHADETAEKLYEIFDKDNVEKEVEEIIQKDEYFSTSTMENLKGNEREQREEFKKIKKEKEIELREEEVKKEYLKKLSLKDDPYEPLKRKVDDDLLQKVIDARIEGIGYVREPYRYYPEKNIGSHLLGFVGYEGENRKGMYGLEGFFNNELAGESGSIRTERAADGQQIILEDREYKKANDGDDIVLTINRSIQYESCRKLEAAAENYGAEGGTVIVMEPETGAILAMCSWPDYDPNNYGAAIEADVYNNPAIFNAYEPGSVFKVMTMAAAIDQNKITPNTTYYDNGFLMEDRWPQPIKNSDFETSGAHGVTDMVVALEKSLNTGAIFAMKKTGEEIFADYVKKFGFGEKTGIELETESSGNIAILNRKALYSFELATASFGQGITATPLQLVASFAVIANGGILMKPYLVSEVITSSGDVSKTMPVQIERVISERAALLVSGMMVSVVDNGHSKRAAVPGYYVAGKTGTAQVASRGGYGEKTIHTFIGFAPVEEPKFVILVKLDAPKIGVYAESTTAPLFGELAKFILDYYKVPVER
ncbi:MAG: penicillin-binding protein 2 [bacterium]